MKILDSVKLLYCLNDDGVNRAYEVLGNLLNNTEYLQVLPEQLDRELKEQREQYEAKWQEEERIEKEKRDAELQAFQDKYKSELLMIDRCFIPWFDNKDMLKVIDVVNDKALWKIREAFTWGYIQGKRAERARRKKVAL